VERNIGRGRSGNISLKKKKRERCFLNSTKKKRGKPYLHERPREGTGTICENIREERKNQERKSFRTAADDHGCPLKKRRGKY